MICRNIFLIGLSFCFLSCSSPLKKPLKKGQLPLEQFFRNPVATNVSVSPDGKLLAALMPFKGRMNVFVRPITGVEWEMVSRFTDRDLNGLMWKGSETLLFSKDFGGDENFHLFSVNLKSKDVKDLTSYKRTRTKMVDDLRGVSKTDVLISMNKRDAKVFDVYRLNVVTGETKMIFQNPGSYMSYLTDHKGNLRMATSTDGVNNTYFYRDIGKTSFRKVMTLNFKQKIVPVVFDKKNRYVYALSNLKRDTISVVKMNPKSGKVLKTIFKNRNYDISHLSYSEKTKELVGASYTDWKFRHHFFSRRFKEIYDRIKKQLPNRDLQIPSVTDEEDLMVIKAVGDRTRGQYYLYNDKTKKLSLILDSSPWLKESQLSKMKPIKYRSRDGLVINGYLTLPKGRVQGLPVIVNPHGGPWHRDRWMFNPQVQFLANRGYAVLQMNFRGSTGYGRKFWESSFKQWGLTMQDDITDGVKWLIGKGIADKDRICIYGGSYGGYATLAGLAFTPDLYKCGVDYVGVSNLFTLMATVPPYWEPMREMFYEMIGDPVKEKDLVRNASPLFSADRIKAPLLVVQGAKDPRVKKSESDQIVAALKKRGVDVPYLVKDNEGHGFRNEENRFEFYRTMENFLDKHLML